MELVWEKYGDFFELSAKKLVIQSSLIYFTETISCFKNQKLMLLVAKLGIFCIQLDLFRCQSNPGS